MDYAFIKKINNNSTRFLPPPRLYKYNFGHSSIFRVPRNFFKKSRYLAISRIFLSCVMQHNKLISL